METTKFIQTYNHHNRIGVIVEFSVQTSITTLNQEFVDFTKGIAMHIAATNPKDMDELLSQSYSLDTSCTITNEVDRMSEFFKERIGIKRFKRWDTEFVFSPADSPEPPDKTPAVAMHIVKS